MLFNPEVLAALDKQPALPASFNIHIFLQLLQNIARSLGYLPHHQEINKDACLGWIKQKINEATIARSCGTLQGLLESIQQIIVCFCYLQTTLSIEKINKEEDILFLLLQAIDRRMDTTDEERYSEKCLLLMLLQPQQLVCLIKDYGDTLRFIDIKQQLQKPMTVCAEKYLQQATNLALFEKLEVLTRIASTWQQLNTITDFNKNKCQLIIGLYLLKHSDLIEAQMVQSSSFLHRAMELAREERERGKQETTKYQCRRAQESSFTFFGYSKKVKLSAATKFFQVLDGQANVVFSPKEAEALTNDHGSRLTDIYHRHHEGATITCK